MGFYASVSSLMCQPFFESFEPELIEKMKYEYHAYTRP